MIDWSAGRYEHTAAELEPAAEHVVALAAPEPGERVADLACGTGNAALLAARAGAQVTGLDMAERLVEVARGRAAEEGLEADFVVGDVQKLPFDDDSFDLILSVFGVIFAPDPERAFGEIVRILRPGGRALFSAWVPAGPIDACVGAFARAMPPDAAPPRRHFAWHEPDEVAELAAAHGVQARLHDASLTITAASPEDYLAAGEQTHPMTLALRPVLDRAGTWESAREQALAALRDGNEDPAAFRVSSPYRVVEITLPQ